MQREYKISLSQEFYSDVVYLSQYDSDYDVIFKVMNKHSAVDVNGKSAKFTGTRKDGLGFTFEAVGIGSYVSFEINTSLTAVAGHHTAEIVFYDSQGLYFGSANVRVVVEPAARKNGTIDANTERAQEIAEEIQEIVDTAAAEVKGEAEAWAVGQRDGVDVPSTDPAYENNAKFYAEQAAQTAEEISGVTEQVAQNTSDISDLKEDLTSIESRMPVNTSDVDTSSYTAIQYSIVDSNKWTGSANVRSWIIPISGDVIEVTANDTSSAVIALLKSNSHTTGTAVDYATGCTRETITAGTTKTYKIPSDANYIYVLKSYTTTVKTPNSIKLTEYIDVPTVDDTLTVSGKSADAKATGDRFASVESSLGNVVSKTFTKPSSGNATLVFAYKLQANKAIRIYWKSDVATATSSINLYSRSTASGENLETLRSNLHADIIYTITPSQDANYIRLVGTTSGTIYVYDADTVTDEINQIKASIDDLAYTVPLVLFGFSHEMYDPSDIFGESGEIGNINGWSSKAEALEKVHTAFDALCASGGAGYGFGERITGLYKESESDEAILDLIAPDYVTNGVTQGETVTLPIGTDSGGNPVTYNYTYESSTQPYEVRLYRFHDTNSALHTATVDIPKKKILLVGGTHGNEFCAPINLYVLAKHLCSDYSNPDTLKLRSSFDVYIVPYLNGFGCQYQWNNGNVLTTGARCNGRMVDINRNCYTAGWVGATGTAEQITANFESKISNLATNTFAGASNGSEFESQLVKALIEWIQPDVFIDHHHNSGNSPFYVTSRGSYAGNLVYQAANDSAYARLHNMSQYYGSKYNLFLGTDVSPATKAAVNGHMQTMAYELGVRMNAVCEMPEAIAYLNGVIDSTTKAATKYSADAFKQAEYTLLNLMLHFCQYAMEN